MDGYTISIDVNATKISATVERRRLLVHILRERAGKTGTHIGCDTSQCGACTVRKDGITVKSCAVLAVQANGHAITTIEGLGDAAHLTPLQQAFHEKPPAEQFLANLEWIARALISANDFRGCAFLNAHAELGSEDSEARELAVAYKESRRLCIVTCCPSSTSMTPILWRRSCRCSSMGPMRRS
jgi:2Fe-2S iron-sulfur cluster binding domain